MTALRYKCTRSTLTRLICGILLATFARSAALAAPAQLHIESDPLGATVTIDETPRGVTPLTLTDLAPGKHLMLVEKRDYDPIRETVTLDSMEKLSREFRLSATRGLILIHSIPVGAEVEIDGAHRGATPLLIADLPLGHYRARLHKPGYISKEIELTIEGRCPTKHDITLTSDSATLKLDSEPTGATVTLSGIARGTTPCSVDRIPSGDLRLELTLEGYELYNESFKLAAGETQTITAILKPIPSDLTIVSIPVGARIYVDNQFRGKSPVKLETLLPNTYRVRAEMAAHDILLRNIDVGRDQHIVEEFRLQRNAGELRITTEPAEVDVVLDGKSVGSTETGTNATDRISQELSIDLLPPGGHVITLTKVGYYESKAGIDIVRDQILTRHFKLKRRFIPNYEIKTSTEVYTGLLIEVDAQKNVKLETHPGIFKTIPHNEILSAKPLRTDSIEEDL